MRRVVTRPIIPDRSLQLISKEVDSHTTESGSNIIGKHLDIFNRRAARGQCFHQPCLGTREFDAKFELLDPLAQPPRAAPEHQTPELGFGVPRDLGIMLWDIAHQEKGKPSLFFRARLDNGVMRIPHPGSEEILR